MVLQPYSCTFISNSILALMEIAKYTCWAGTHILYGTYSAHITACTNDSLYLLQHTPKEWDTSCIVQIARTLHHVSCDLLSVMH